MRRRVASTAGNALARRASLTECGSQRRAFPRRGVAGSIPAGAPFRRSGFTLLANAAESGRTHPECPARRTGYPLPRKSGSPQLVSMIHPQAVRMRTHVSCSGREWRSWDDVNLVPHRLPRMWHGRGDARLVVAADREPRVVPALSLLARAIRVPYPIVLVLGGLPLAFIPGIPEVELDPELVLVIFLPPLLYAAAFFANARKSRQMPGRLAVGLPSGPVHDGSRGPRRPLHRRRLAVGGGVHARCNCLPDRSGRGHGDLPTPRCPSTARRDHRGRVADERQHGPDRLPGRGRCDGEWTLRSEGPRRASSSAWSVGSRSGWRSPG